jgi:predicted deacylase
VQERAHELALAFGLRYVICSASDGTRIGGTTSAAAADAGIPAIIPEAGGCGLLGEAEIELHARGLENTLRQLGMLPGDPDPPHPDTRLLRRFVWLRSPAAGWWRCDVRPGQTVEAGERLGALCDLHGEPLATVGAPEAGVVIFTTTSPAVAEDGVLAAVGA